MGGIPVSFLNQNNVGRWKDIVCMCACVCVVCMCVV